MSIERKSWVLVLGFTLGTACAGNGVVDDPGSLVDEELENPSEPAGADGGTDVGDEPEGGDGLPRPADETCREGWAEELVEASEIPRDAAFSGQLERCRPSAHFVVLAAGMEMEIDVNGLPRGARVSVRDGLGGELAVGVVADGALRVAFAPERSGEVTVTLTSESGELETPYDGEIRCLAGCHLEATRYPIVLVHGMGNEAYFTFADYFYGIEEDLLERGYDVHAPLIPYLEHSAVRAERLAEAVVEILESTGASKIHLIGHSQGGLDVRVLVTGLGFEDRAASMTTIATPHRGIRTVPPGWFAGMDISVAYMNGEFASRYPASTTVPTFSYAGATCLATNPLCLADLDGEIVTPQLASTYTALLIAHFDDAYDGANDGAVPASSAEWGLLLGILPADHWDQIGHIPGQRLGPFDHHEFFLSEARRLRRLELAEVH